MEKKVWGIILRVVGGLLLFKLSSIALYLTILLTMILINR